MTMYRTAFVLSIILGITSCMTENSFIRDRSQDYRKSEQAVSLSVSKSAKKLESIYSIPDIKSNTLDDSFEVSRPQLKDLSVDSHAKNVRLAGISHDSWVYVAKNPSHVWAQVLSFVQSLPVSSQKENIADSSVIYEIEGKIYFIRVESSLLLDSSEVRVRHLKDKKWIGRANTETASMEGKVASYIENTLYTEYSVSIKQDGIQYKPKAALVTDQGIYLDVYVPFSRIWAALSYALNTGGYRIKDKDVSKSVYYATFEDRESSIFIFFFGKDNPLYQFTIEKHKGYVRIKIKHAKDNSKIDDIEKIQRLRRLLQNLA